MDHELIGEVVDGYAIGPVVGVGAMGRVYRAYHVETQRPAAFKVMQPELANDPDYRARFLREAELTSTLHHPHIVAVYAYGEWAGFLYIAMQFVRGTSLNEVMAHHRFTPISAWHVVQPVMEALSYGHSQGVIHRDLKPSNILVESRKGRPFVLLGDFGLGKRPGLDATLTASGISVGTPEYMSPEIVMGTRVDHRADLYSFGALLYQLLLGHVPFHGKNAQLTALAHVEEMVPAPRSLNPAFPHRLEIVLFQALEKQVNGRFRSAGALSSAYFEALGALTDTERRTCYWGKA